MDVLMDYREALEKFDVVIGLEVHVELNTASKMYCACSTAPAEAQRECLPDCVSACPDLCLQSIEAIESAVRIGLMLNCEIAAVSRFARKNYFYPDMAKDYQLSQSDEPICHDGYVDIDLDRKSYTIPVERLHMEEDAGKILHVGGSGRIQDAPILSHQLQPCRVSP